MLVSGRVIGKIYHSSYCMGWKWDFFSPIHNQTTKPKESLPVNHWETPEIFHRCNGEITWKAVTLTTAPLESTILGPLHIKMHTLRLEGYIYKHCKVNGLLVWNCLAPPILHESTLISREMLNVDHNCFSRITTKQWCLLGTRKFSGIGNSWTLIRG